MGTFYSYRTGNWVDIYEINTKKPYLVVVDFKRKHLSSFRRKLRITQQSARRENDILHIGSISPLSH